MKMDMTISPPSAPEPANPYADIALNFLHRSLESSLAQVQAVETALPDHERTQAVHVLEYGLKFTNAWPTSRELTKALSPYIERSGDWESGNETLLHAIRTAQNAGDLDGEITLRALYARLLQRQGQTQETIRQYRRVIRMARQHNNRFEEARACSNLGYLFIDEGRFWRSEVLCQHALGIFEELESHHGLAHTHNHLGLLFTRQRVYKQAEAHLKRAFQLWTELQDGHSLCMVCSNLGLLYNESGQTEQAISYLELALQEAERTGEYVQIANTWNNLGFSQLQYNDFSQAEISFEKALHIYSQYANDIEQARTLNNLGLVFLRREQYAQAAIQFQKAYNFFEKSNYSLELADIQHSLGLTYQYLRRWKEATPLLEKAQQIFKEEYQNTEEIKILVALTANQLSSNHQAQHYLARIETLLTKYPEDDFQQLFFQYRQEYCASLSKWGSK